MIALLLDLANIVGGFLLAIGLLVRLPSVGDDLANAAKRIGPFGWIVGLVALICGGYFLIVHLISGPRVFHFEVVGLITAFCFSGIAWTCRGAPERICRPAERPARGLSWPYWASSPSSSASRAC